MSGILIYGFVISGESSEFENFGKDGNEVVQQFRQSIKDGGALQAYKIFSEANQPRDVSRQHEMAHMFGAALYAEEGVDGLAVCDAQFSFGCYHEFLGQAIADLGIDSVTALNERCHNALGSRSLSCQHGIGHGVQTFFGYSRTHLDEALKVCEELPYADPIGGCYGGVFMEYNVRTMLGTQASVRDYTGDRHEPCSELDQPFKLACYYWQPQWWSHVLFKGAPGPEEYAQMGTFCNEISDREIRGHCYEGIGNITEQHSGRDPLRAVELCVSISDDPAAQLRCRSVAANHFGIDVSPEAARAVCEGLKGPSRDYCLNYASNTFNAAVQGEFPLSF